MRVRAVHGMLAVALAVAVLPAATAASTSADGQLVGERAAETARSRQARPNVILFLTDDMRLDDLQYMPNVLRLLGRHGVTFTDAFSPDPLCCPARATLLSGQYAHTTHVIGNNAQDSGGVRRFEQFVDQTKTLPATLHKAGYRTWHIGKHLNGFKSVKPPPGWDYWNATIDGEYNYRDWTVAVQGHVHRHTQSYQETVLRHTLLSWLGKWAPSRQPFFMWVGHLAPHASEFANPPLPEDRFRGAFAGYPFPLPPSFMEADVSDKPRWVSQEPGRGTPRRARLSYEYRVETLLSVDQTVAATVARLHELGEYKRTVMIFTSDNGFNIGEHRHHAKNVIYEESLHVPLIIAGPGGFPPDTVSRKTVSLADLPATILDLANARPGLRQDGVSLARAAAPSGLLPHRVIPIEGGTWEYPRMRSQPTDPMGRFYWGARWTHYVYAQYATGEREFYDLDKDPFELDNAYQPRAQPGSVQRLMQRWVRLHKNCHGTTCRIPLRPRP